jgi:hypothetical protein
LEDPTVKKTTARKTTSSKTTGRKATTRKPARRTVAAPKTPPMTKDTADARTKEILAAKTRPVDVQVVKGATIGMRLVTRRFNNEKKADLSKVQTAAEKKMLKMEKSLLDSPELKAISAFDLACQIWLSSAALPSYLMSGLYRIPVAKVRAIYDGLVERERMRGELVSAFLERYTALKQEAAALLADQYDPADYPKIDVVASKFKFEYFFMDIDEVPDQLKSIDAAIYGEAVRKTEAKLAQVVADIRLGMSEAFSEVIAHMAERLQTGPDGKPKVFRDSLVNNLTEFFEDFPLRNVTNDEGLTALVQKAKAVMAGITPDDLRDAEGGVRAKVAKNIAQIKSAVDAMVVERTRAISFSSTDL